MCNYLKYFILRVTKEKIIESPLKGLWDLSEILVLIYCALITVRISDHNLFNAYVSLQ